MEAKSSFYAAGFTLCCLTAGRYITSLLLFMTLRATVITLCCYYFISLHTSMCVPPSFFPSPPAQMWILREIDIMQKFGSGFVCVVFKKKKKKLEVNLFKAPTYYSCFLCTRVFKDKKKKTAFRFKVIVTFSSLTRGDTRVQVCLVMSQKNRNYVLLSWNLGSGWFW